MNDEQIIHDLANGFDPYTGDHAPTTTHSCVPTTDRTAALAANVTRTITRRRRTRHLATGATASILLVLTGLAVSGRSTPATVRTVDTRPTVPADAGREPTLSEISNRVWWTTDAAGQLGSQWFRLAAPDDQSTGDTPTILSCDDGATTTGAPSPSAAEPGITGPDVTGPATNAFYERGTLDLYRSDESCSNGTFVGYLSTAPEASPNIARLTNIRIHSTARSHFDTVTADLIDTSGEANHQTFVDVTHAKPPGESEIVGEWTATRSDPFNDRRTTTVVFESDASGRQTVTGGCIEEGTWELSSGLTIRTTKSLKCAADLSLNNLPDNTPTRSVGAVLLLQPTSNPADWIVLRRSNGAAPDPTNLEVRLAIVDDLVGKRFVITAINDQPAPEGVAGWMAFSGQTVSVAACGHSSASWSLTEGELTLTGHELFVADETCRETPLLAAIRHIWGADNLTVTTKLGEPVLRMAAGSSTIELTQLNSSTAMDERDWIANWRVPDATSDQEQVNFGLTSDHQVMALCALLGSWGTVPAAAVAQFGEANHREDLAGRSVIIRTPNPVADCVGPPSTTVRHTVDVLNSGALMDLVGGRYVITPAFTDSLGGVWIQPDEIPAPADLPSTISTRTTAEVPATNTAPATADTTTSNPAADFTFNPGLRWTVTFVEPGDVLNIRAKPDAASQVVGILPPATSGIIAGDDSAKNGTENWRRVNAGDGQSSNADRVEGWVNARYLTAQPTNGPNAGELQSLTSQIGRWIVSGTTGLAATDTDPASWLAAGGLWIGGLGIYGDAPTSFERIEQSELLEHSAWTTPRAFQPPDGFETMCINDCTTSLTDFIGLDRLDGLFATKAMDIANSPADTYRDGPLPAEFRSIASVTVDYAPADPALSNAWRRIHFFYEYSTGSPKLFAIYTWGWTP